MSTWTVRARDLTSLLGSNGSSFRCTCLGVPCHFAGSHDTHLEMNNALRAPRAPASVKSCLLPPRQVVATYPGQHDRGAAGQPMPERVTVGVRACELKAMTYLDRVFGHPPVSDPFYQQRRQGQVVVSVDCVEPHATCFCHLVGGGPFAEEGFDLNLTPIEDGYVIQSGSRIGEEMISRADGLVREATQTDIANRDEVRRNALERLKEINTGYDGRDVFGPMSADLERHEGWSCRSDTCVECGACTQICPTCHCFYLFDRLADDQRFHRLRAWDSCIWSGYSRMAGAHRMKPNPRSQFRSRFANRFLHKYVWSPQQLEMLGCVGCGRCIEACPGQIDIRDVLKEVSAWSQ